MWSCACVCICVCFCICVCEFCAFLCAHVCRLHMCRATVRAHRCRAVHTHNCVHLWVCVCPYLGCVCRCQAVLWCAGPCVSPCTRGGVRVCVCTRLCAPASLSLFPLYSCLDDLGGSSPTLMVLCCIPGMFLCAHTCVCRCLCACRGCVCPCPCAARWVRACALLVPGSRS